MTRFTVLLTLLSAMLCFMFGIFGICTPGQKSHGFEQLSNDQVRKLDSICTAFIDRGNTVGLSLGIANGSQILYEKGFGYANLEEDRLATGSTIYPIASVSKMITAFMILQLLDEGVLNLSDQISKHIPGLPEQEFINEITIEHLLRHQSGLVDHEDWMDSIYINHRRIFSKNEFITFLDRPLMFRPGSQYSYSNSGYYLLSMVLEIKEQMDFNSIVQNRISEPLGLKSLGLWPGLWSHKNATVGYELHNSRFDTSFHMMTESMKGDGGLGASIHDLLKLSQSLLNGDLLSPSSFDLLISPSSIREIVIDYGLGVKMGMYAGQPTFGHSGGYSGTGWAILAHYPESEFIFAAAMNTSYSPDEVWTLRHFVMPIVLNLPIPNHKDQSIEHPEIYLGEYGAINRWGGTQVSKRVVTTVDNGLFWDNPDTDTPGEALYPTGRHRFSWNTFPFDEFKFHLIDGEVKAASEYYDGMFANVRMKL